jgi:hypothetical protein
LLAPIAHDRRPRREQTAERGHRLLGTELLPESEEPVEDDHGDDGDGHGRLASDHGENAAHPEQ